MAKYSFQQGTGSGGPNPAMQAQIDYQSERAAGYGTEYLQDETTPQPHEILERLAGEVASTGADPSVSAFLTAQAAVVRQELSGTEPNRLIVLAALQAAATVSQSVPATSILIADLMDQLNVCVLAFSPLGNEMTELALIVMPTRLDGNVEGPPQFYLLRNGVWRDVPLVSAKPTTPTAVRASIQKVLTAIIGNAGGGTAKNLLAFFANLSAAFLPDRVRSEINALPRSELDPPRLLIYVHPSLEWIPCELLHDGTGYLGLRCAVARLPLVLQGPAMTNGPVHTVRRVVSFLGNNVIDDQAQATWRGTFNGLPAGVTLDTFPASDGIWPTADMVADVKEADILHVTCHGGIEDKTFTGEMSWTLDHQGEEFMYGVNSSLVRQMGSVALSEPLVFGNACASVKDPQDPGGLVPGLASAFFDAGAVNFVGAFAPINGPVAVAFATAFYKHLLVESQPVGVALWRTKKDFQAAAEQHPSWLFYCLYGSPETTFVTQ